MQVKKKRLQYFAAVIVVIFLLSVFIQQNLKLNTYKVISNDFTISTFGSLRAEAHFALEIIEHRHIELYSMEELRELVNHQTYISHYLWRFNHILSTIDPSLTINHGEFSVLEQIRGRVASTEEGIDHVVLNEGELEEIDHFRNICKSIVVEHEKYTTFVDLFLVDEVSTILRNLEEENYAYKFSRVKLR
ncbi:hypothetical protein [Bacillus horti]|uniref:Uncharacterized protein n=1 Tax=Caldalkalibacillus horti TaxID=77523 RepID=A0ABT9W1M9_9BACI|nr:hypothetical protein [Bacillus horti]MDQ0167166.1 hypothetical protein [Bacillus horti]